MRVKYCLLVLLFLLSYLPSLLAQPRGGQRLMTYQDFKTECIQFTRQQSGELWVVFFWSSLNSASLYDLPELNRIANSFQNKPIRFIGVSENRNDARWRQALEAHNPPGDQVLLSNVENLMDIKRAFQYERLPGYFVVGMDGSIYNPTNINSLRNFLTLKVRDLPNVSGGEITIPVVNTPVEQPSTGSGSGQWITHTVQRGETLYRLHVKYDVPIETLRRNNDLRGNTIQVGQVLKIRRK